MATVRRWSPRFKSDIDIPDLPEQERVSFSDLNMTCTPLRKRGNRGIVFNQFLRLVHAQSILLIDEGVLIRGGIAVGQDDASSEIYYAQLVEEESTRTVMTGVKEVIERKGLFCALYSDRGSHFFYTPKAGIAV